MSEEINFAALQEFKERLPGKSCMITGKKIEASSENPVTVYARNFDEFRAGLVICEEAIGEGLKAAEAEAEAKLKELQDKAKKAAEANADNQSKGAKGG